MNSNRTLLIPIDFSNASKIALRFALSNEYKNGDQIILAHCYRLISDDSHSSPAAPRQLKSAIEKKIKSDYKAFCKSLALDRSMHNIDFKLKIGFTANCIQALVHESSSDLIVFGLKAEKQSNTLTKLIQSASVPVILVSEKIDTKSKEQFSKKTITPEDFSKQSQFILKNMNQEPNVPYLVIA